MGSRHETDTIPCRKVQESLSRQPALGRHLTQMAQAERREMPEGIPGGRMNKVRKSWKGGKGSGVREVPKVKGGTGKAGTGWLRWVTCMPGQ